jgi:hypothetical protein
MKEQTKADSLLGSTASGDSDGPPSTASKVPNPGSPDAMRSGCRCAVLDNARGRGYLGGNGKDWDDGGIFAVSSCCPLHWPTDEATDR